MDRIVYYRRDGCGYVKKLEDKLPALRNPMALEAAGIAVAPPGHGQPTPSIKVNGRVVQGSDQVLPILHQALSRTGRRGSMPTPAPYGYGTFGTYGPPMNGWGGGY